MAEKITHYRIFIASPSGLEEERRAFKDAITRYNDTDAVARRIIFSPVGWEYTLNRQGRPQSLINEELRRCDHFVLVLHTRWGSSPGGATNYTSGTEEEFAVARECLLDPTSPLKSIAIFFKTVNEQMLADPGPSLSRVLQFQQELEQSKEFLYRRFDDVEVFRDVIYMHLANWVREHEYDGAIQTGAVHIPRPAINVDADMERRSEADLRSQLFKLLDEAEDLARQKRTVEAERKFSDLTVAYADPWCMARFGRFLRKTGNRHRATDLLTKAIEYSRQKYDRKTEAYALRQLGQVRERNGDLHGAIAQYHMAIEMYKTDNDKAGLARTYRDMALAHRKIGEFARALDFLDESLVLSSELGDKYGIAAAYGYRGVMQKGLGQVGQALKSHARALEITLELGDVRGTAAAKSNMGIIHRMMGDVDSALRHHNEALDSYRELRDLQGQTRELSNIGTCYRDMGNYESAVENHSRALAIAEQLQNRQGIAIQYGNLGRDNFHLNRLAIAEELHIQALNICKSIEDVEGQAWQYEALGRIELSRGNIRDSEDYLNRAHVLFSRIGAGIGLASTQRLLGQCIVRSGHHKEGIFHYREAARLYLSQKMNREFLEIRSEVFAIDPSFDGVLSDLLGGDLGRATSVPEEPNNQNE